MLFLSRGAQLERTGQPVASDLNDFSLLERPFHRRPEGHLWPVGEFLLDILLDSNGRRVALSIGALPDCLLDGADRRPRGRRDASCLLLARVDRCPSGDGLLYGLLLSLGLALTVGLLVPIVGLLVSIVGLLVSVGLGRARI